MALFGAGVEDYAREKSEPVPELLERLEADTRASMQYPQMLTGALEGRFLKMLVQLTGARNILEIGMFTGYSALSMLEGASDEARLTTLDIDPDCVRFARNYFDQSPLGKRITIIEGPALDSLGGLTGPFDFVFIDADKPNYKAYYEMVLPLVAQGGLIVVDNVLWSGQVLDSASTDANTMAIQAFNDLVARDDRVDRVLLTVRDGVYLLRKR